MTQYRNQWTAQLRAAGHGNRAWRFQALTLRHLAAELDLPPGLLAETPTVATSTETGFINILVNLTPAGAQAWKTALDQNRPGALQGMIRTTIRYYAGEGSQIRTRQRHMNASLGTLASRADSGTLAQQIVRPETTFDAYFQAIGDPNVDTIAVELQPSNGQAPETHIFGPEGGAVTLQITSADPQSVEIDWTMTVNYAPTDWPVVEASGTLDFNNRTEIQKAGTWINTYQLTAMLIDDLGSVVPAGSDEAIDIDNRVYGSLSFAAPYIDNGTPRSTAFETSSQQIIAVAFPKPPGQSPGDIHLTAFAVRQGRDDMRTRSLQPAETMSILKVYPNGRIEIITNLDTVSESAPEATALGIMGALSG
jgi:hypothetical protein